MPPSPLDVVYGQQEVLREYIIVDALRAQKVIDKVNKIHLQVQETLKRSWLEKYKEINYQHKVDKTFKVGDRVWLHLNKEILHGPSKKINSLWYVFLKLEKIGDNSYRLNLPPYMHSY